MTTFTATPDPTLREPFEVGQVQWLRKPGDGGREGLMAGFWHVTPEEMPAGTAHEFPFDETIYVVEGAMRIDVEGGELAVVAGMRRMLARDRPVLLVEVSEESARELARSLDSYSGFRVGRRLEPLESGRGLFNALFVPQPPV